jgi:C1A family cysteine protease
LIKTAFCILLLALACGTAVALDPEQINRLIAEQGADWTAGTTSVSQLSPEERCSLVGGLEEADDRGLSWSAPAESRTAAMALDAFDWRSHNGANWLPEIRDQGGCGSCAAFAALGGVEAAFKVYSGLPGLPIDLSEQHLFSCGGGSCIAGWYISSALDFLKYVGVADERCFPYQGIDGGCELVCPDWFYRSWTIDDWAFVTSYTADTVAIKTAILQTPVPCRMIVYEDFYSYTGGVYSHVTGSDQGGHFVVLVGWNDALDCWIARNSWGTDWGEGGYFMIRRGEAEIGTWTAIPSVSAIPAVFVSTNAYSYSGGDLFQADLRLLNPWADRDTDLYVALAIEDNLFFWPGWLETPLTISFTMPAALDASVTLLGPTNLPSPLPPGGPYHFYALLCATGQYNLQAPLSVWAFSLTD